MRFDPQRALATFDRLSAMEAMLESSGETTADLVAESIREHGWRVERRTVHGSASADHVRLWLRWLLVASGMTLAVLLARNEAGAYRVLLVWVLTSFAWLWTWLRGAPRAWRLPPLRSALLVIASRPVVVTPPARVVMTAKLGGPRSGGTGSRNAASWLLLACPSLLLLVITLGGRPFAPESWKPALGAAGWACVGLLWLALAANILAGLRSVIRTAGITDRVALAMLLELARTWPPSRSSRVEAVLAVVGGAELDHAGDRELAVFLEGLGPAPTMVVALEGDEAARELLLNSDVDFVAEAASSLRVPHRVGPVHRVTLTGRRNPDLNAEASGPIGPELITQAAQVLEEASLRWARRHAAQASELDRDRSDERSSQKPG